MLCGYNVSYYVGFDVIFCVIVLRRLVFCYWLLVFCYWLLLSHMLR